jgi:transposase
LKREIVAASLTPGSSVSLVARRYDVNANQVFAWRRRYRAGSAEPAYRVRIGSGVKASALRLVLDVLERR